MKTRLTVLLVIFLALSLLGAVLNYPSENADTTGLVAADIAWMLTATALVLLMTPGLSFFYGGMVQKKNVISTMLQSFISMGVVSVLWVVVGFSLAFGESIGGSGTGIIGNPLTFFMFKNVGIAPDAGLSPTIPFALFAMFQLKFAIITPALITGSFAERVRFSSYLLFICLFIVFIYAPLAHMTWHPNGLFRNWGVLDFAGGTVVHMSAGFAALAGAFYLGPRVEQKQIQANLPYVLLGTGMLWFGWFGFNAGSALQASGLAVTAFINTNTASAAAMLAWVFFEGAKGNKPTALGASIAAVVGLVAITPAAGYVSVGASIFIGAAASLVSNLAISMKSKTTLDDTLDVFPAHGMGGIVGMILTAVFATNGGLLTGETSIFMYHLLALLIVGVYVFTGSYALYWLTDKIWKIRVTKEQEEEGLDISQHNESIDIKLS